MIKTYEELSALYNGNNFGLYIIGVKTKSNAELTIPLNYKQFYSIVFIECCKFILYYRLNRCTNPLVECQVPEEDRLEILLAIGD